MAATGLAANFKIGGKELFLPNVHLTFLRTRTLPPDQAKFHVPIWFSKLDIRDYLWHVYNVRVLSVRSYVQQQRVQQGDPKNARPQPRRWHRPRSQKFMTVTLERPFVWPERPRDYSPWNKDEAVQSAKERAKLSQEYSPTRDTLVNENRRTRMREQAKAILADKTAWTPPKKTDDMVLSTWR